MWYTIFIIVVADFSIAVTVSDIRKIMTDLTVWREEQGV